MKANKLKIYLLDIHFFKNKNTNHKQAKMNSMTQCIVDVVISAFSMLIQAKQVRGKTSLSLLLFPPL